MKKKERVIFLVDMNAFYASVHQNEDPRLRHKPVIVGGASNSRKGIVLAKSYACLAYGPVRTAMPMHEALAICPEAVVVRPDHDLYETYAQRIRDVLASFSPLVEPNSIDEAFLDMTGTERLFGSPIQAAQMIQKHIYEQVGLPCSIGIGKSKITAKMAADLKKPWGISTIWPSEVEEKMHPLDVVKLNGVGKKTAQLCQKLAIQTIGDLAKADRKTLQRVFGNTAEKMQQRALGLGDDVVDPQKYVKNRSMGNAKTYEKNLVDLETLNRELYQLCHKTALRLRKEQKKSRTIAVSIKDQHFITTSKSLTLDNPTDLTEEIYELAQSLLEKLWKKQPVRLLGLSLENIAEQEDPQMRLFGEEEKIKLQETLDRLQDKYGASSVHKGRLLK